MSLSYRGIDFSFGRGRRVLSGFDWTVPGGRTVLLGPNGAGKSTLLRIGTGTLRPQRGSATFDGVDLGRRRRARVAVGWMPQHSRTMPHLTLHEQVAYVGWLRGMTRGKASRAAHEALRAVDLAERSAERGSRLSGGQLRRLALAEALVHEPRVLLLDEPTAGLDPAQRARFRSLLIELDDTVPVVLSTHQVDDLDELFHRVIVLIRGRIRWQGSVTEFLRTAPAGSARPAEAAYAAIIGGEE